MNLTMLTSAPTRRRPRLFAFTLVELLVVMLIIAVLAAMIIPRIMSRTGDAKQTRARADLSTLSKSMMNFRYDVGYYPATEEGLDALMVQPGDADGWRGPYLEQAIPNWEDPWGNPYIYEFPGPNGDDSFLLMSLGSDNAEGGEGEAADVYGSGG